MIGDITMDDNHLRTICVDLQPVIVNVEYRCVMQAHFPPARVLISMLLIRRRVPETPFPAPFEDSYAAVKWVRDVAWKTFPKT